MGTWLASYETYVIFLNKYILFAFPVVWQGFPWRPLYNHSYSNVKRRDSAMILI